MKKITLTILITLCSFYLSAQIDAFKNSNSGVVAYYQEQELNPRRFGTIDLPELNFAMISTNDFYVNSGDFDTEGTLWGVTAYTSQLVTIDINTGSITEVGPLSGVMPNHNNIGLSYDPSSGTMYFISDDVNSTATSGMLYSVNTAAGELTPIGELGTPQPVWLEIDNDGNAYLGDANTNSLYSVDLATGAATLIGSFGEINLYDVRHGASFDHASNTLYMVSTINDFLLKSHFYTINLANGEATDLGNTYSGQYSLFAIPMEQANGVNDVAAPDVTGFPNPTKGGFNIVLGKTYADVSVTVIHSSGQIIRSNSYHNTDRISLEINGPDGIYLIRVSTSDGLVKSLRVMKGL